MTKLAILVVLGAVLAGCGGHGDRGEPGVSASPSGGGSPSPAESPPGGGSGAQCAGGAELVEVELGASFVTLVGTSPIDLDGDPCATVEPPSGAPPTLVGCETWFACDGCLLRIGKLATMQPRRRDPWFVESRAEGDDCPGYGIRASFDAQ